MEQLNKINFVYIILTTTMLNEMLLDFRDKFDNDVICEILKLIGNRNFDFIENM